MTYGPVGLQLEPLPLTAARLLTTLPVPPTAPASTSLSSDWLTCPVSAPYWFSCTLLAALCDLWKEKLLVKELHWIIILTLLWHLRGATGLPKNKQKKTSHRGLFIQILQGTLKYTVVSVYCRRGLCMRGGFELAYICSWHKHSLEPMALRDECGISASHLHNTIQTSKPERKWLLLVNQFPWQGHWTPRWRTRLKCKPLRSDSRR